MIPDVRIVATSIPRAVPDDAAHLLWGEAPDEGAFLLRLREMGASKIESIKVLREVSGMTLGEAKEAVHFSPAWGDRRASDESFQESAIWAMEDHQHEETQNPERLAS